MKHKFFIGRVTLSVKPLPQSMAHFTGLPDVTTNGQHLQRPGYVLAEFNPDEGVVHLLHPETGATSGHIDVLYHLQWEDGNPRLEQYRRNELDVSNEKEVRHCWPDGWSHLLQTILSIDTYLTEECGVENAQFAKFIASNIMQGKTASKAVAA